MLVDDRGTCAWMTYPESLPDSRLAMNQAFHHTAHLLQVECLDHFTESGKWLPVLASGRHSAIQILCSNHPQVRGQPPNYSPRKRPLNSCVGLCLYVPRLLDNSRIRQLVDWMTHGLVNSCAGQVMVWTTHRCHQRLYVLSFRSFVGICETVSCPVRDLSSPRVD